MAQLVKRLTSTQVMISWLMSSSPALGSVLTVQSLGPVLVILWGANAKSKEKLITGKQHLILKGAHPSPLSAYNGFFGGKYFSKANEFLEANGETPVDWRII